MHQENEESALLLKLLQKISVKDAGKRTGNDYGTIEEI